MQQTMAVRFLRRAILFLLVILPAHPALTAPREVRQNQASERIEVTIVLIDVIVRDRKDRPVPGLAREDFELRIDSHRVDPDDIQSFEEICPGIAPALEGTVTQTGPAIASRQDHDVPVQIPGHIVLYFDFTQLSFAGRQLALGAVERYLSESTGLTDRVMILSVVQGELSREQEFTSDLDLLLAGIRRLKQDTGTVDLDVAEEIKKLGAVASKPKGPERLFLAKQLALEEAARARRSIEVMRKFLPSLAGLKGRKALVVFTDVFRLEPGAQYLALAGTTPFMAGVDIFVDLDRLLATAVEYGVAFYTVHAGGLEDGSADLIRLDGATAKVANVGAQEGVDSAIGLQIRLAEDSGGRALHYTNDVGAIVKTARQDLSCYYLLSYRYQARGDGQRHRVAIRVKPHGEGQPRRGLRVRHRPYFIDRASRSGTAPVEEGAP